MATPISLLGLAHTLFSVVAIACAVRAVATSGQIDPRTRTGQVYAVATLLTAATALAIFKHGRFGPAHALAVLTVVGVVVGVIAAYGSVFGRFGPVLRVASMSATMLFHAIPGVTEALTRLPLDAPLLASAEAPELKPVYAGLLVLFGLGLWMQWRVLGRKPAPTSSPE